jgi:carboxylate-amine ligase
MSPPRLVSHVSPSRTLPTWAEWGGRASWPWSVRLSEDVMLIDPERGVLAPLSDEEIHTLSPLLTGRCASALEGSVVRLTTAPHDTVEAAAADLGLLRATLATALEARHARHVLAAGMHPWSECPDPAVGHGHARAATEIWGILGRLDPTCSLRIDVAVPDPETALRSLNGLRVHLPLILALGADSPFWRGRFTGFASARTALRASLGHTGMPRRFRSYRDYVATMAALIDSGAIRGPSAIDWDARLRPDEGVVEVAIADAQPRVSDVSALAAFVQCLVRLHATGESDLGDTPIPEVLLENRLAAAKKGIRAEMIDVGGTFSQPATEELRIVGESCAAVGRELDCARQLAAIGRLAADPGHIRQRHIASREGLAGVVAYLSSVFVEPLAVEARIPA